MQQLINFGQRFVFKSEKKKVWNHKRNKSEINFFFFFFNYPNIDLNVETSMNFIPNLKQFLVWGISFKVIF